MTARLPYVDEHAITVTAGVDDIWSALIETVNRRFSRPGAARYARLVGCADTADSGPRPLVRGAVIPGFRVVSASEGSELALRGRHRFSTYELIFRIEQAGAGRARLRAETRAAFPGLFGGLYRLLVIGTGGHAWGMRRMLAAVAETHS